jgi:thiol:disulfide interchange protein DsbD
MCCATLLLLTLMAAPAAAAKDPVQLESFVSTDAVTPGDTFHIAVRMAMDEDWHTQSNQPSDELFIATELTLEAPEGMAVTSLLYPAGHELDAPALGGRLSVYSNGDILGAAIQVEDGAAVGPVALKGGLRYQACNDRTCLFPKTKDVTFQILVSPDAPATTLHPGVFDALLQHTATAPPAAAGASASPEQGQSSVADDIEESGFSLWLLGVFLLGLGLNLTPCVYPVIAVTLSYFGNQGGSTAARSARAAAYALGIVTMFTGLFLLAGLSGQLFGAWLQHPWVLGAMALVMVVLALSSFGLYELQAPAFLRNRMAGGRAGIAGGYFMGLAMGIVAAPCVGPLLGGLLLWVGQQGSMTTAAIVGLSLSAGLAVPYFLLGIFSGSLGALPRSGDWMDWVKHAMGYLLLGVALYFLGPLLPREWFLPSFAVLASVAALHLAFVDRAGRSSHVVSFAKGVVVTAAGVAVYILLSVSQAAGIEWQPYTSHAVERAASDGRPVMIEFTADWCIPCRVLEYGAFKDSEVIQESDRFVRLRVDLTHQEEPTALEAVERYQVAGPPVIVFLGGDGSELTDLRVLESMDPEELLERMRSVPATVSASGATSSS